MKLNWLCPICLDGPGQVATCECGYRPLALGAPGEVPAFIGHLILLDEVPPPSHLLGAVCDGNPRHSVERTSRCQTACWCHGGRSVWMWQQNFETLPPMGTRPDPEQIDRLTPFMRALSLSNLLLLELLGDDRHFRARYARQRNGREPPELAELIDQLEYALSTSFPKKFRAIALLDPTRLATPEDQARLRCDCHELQTFDGREKALGWLLEQCVESPTRSEPPSLHAGRVGIVDVGGVVGRELLSRLHHETFRADEQRFERGRWLWTRATSELVKLSDIPFGRGRRLWTRPTEEGRRRYAPKPGDALPAWSGVVRSWWWSARIFTVELDPEEETEPRPEEEAGLAAVVGVGPSRHIGQPQLARLLERSWTGRLVPSALLRGEDADKVLLRWVRQCFPAVPEYLATTLEGGLCAVRSALFRARYRVGV